MIPPEEDENRNINFCSICGWTGFAQFHACPGPSEASNLPKVKMLTKQKGDIAEQAAILEVLKRGWGVCKPVGDRNTYDMVFDIHGVLVKIQVKSAWKSKKGYAVDTRRTKTNRRVMVRSRYTAGDFDFALLYVDEFDLFYIVPLDVFNSYVGAIHLTATSRASLFKERWDLLEKFVSERTVKSPLDLGEAAN